MQIRGCWLAVLPHPHADIARDFTGTIPASAVVIDMRKLSGLRRVLDA
jgi:hypothetical protein